MGCDNIGTISFRYRTLSYDMNLLPLSQGQLWNAHQLLARPPNTKLDVRWGEFTLVVKNISITMNDLIRCTIARVQRELTLGAVLVVRSLRTCWSLPRTSQDKGGRLDAQDGRGCACA